MNTIILELPEEKKEIKILNRIYEIDITDFNILTKIKALPCMVDKFTPDNERIGALLRQFQDIFMVILGEELPFPQASSQLAYFKARAILVQLYNIIIEEQEKYLNLEYSVKQGNKDNTDKMLEIVRNLAKINPRTDSKIESRTDSNINAGEDNH